MRKVSQLFRNYLYVLHIHVAPCCNENIHLIGNLLSFNQLKFLTYRHFFNVPCKVSIIIINFITNSHFKCKYELLLKCIIGQQLFCLSIKSKKI